MSDNLQERRELRPHPSTNTTSNNLMPDTTDREVAAAPDPPTLVLEPEPSGSRCANCANLIEDGGYFCEHCGAKIVQGAHSSAPANQRSVKERSPDSKVGVEVKSSRGYRRVRNAAAAFAVLLLFFVGVVVFSVSRVRSPKGVQTDAKAGAANRGLIERSFPEDMVYVPGGNFTMGNDLGDEYERPEHTATVKPFLIDIHEVTLEQYQQFMNATGRKAPVNWTTQSSGSKRLPVTGVDWYDAAAYAAWAGKRLATEQEWELAARGFDRRKYPWGHKWQSGFANAGDSSAGRAVEVGSHPNGKSPFGAVDMVGNVWEWTASDLEAYPASEANPPRGVRKVIRGGSWALDSPADWTTTFRGFAIPAGGKDYSKTGFRCAMDVKGGKK